MSIRFQNEEKYWEDGVIEGVVQGFKEGKPTTTLPATVHLGLRIKTKEGTVALDLFNKEHIAWIETNIPWLANFLSDTYDQWKKEFTTEISGKFRMTGIPVIQEVIMSKKKDKKWLGKQKYPLLIEGRQQLEYFVVARVNHYGQEELHLSPDERVPEGMFGRTFVSADEFMEELEQTEFLVLVKDDAWSIEHGETGTDPKKLYLQGYRDGVQDPDSKPLTKTDFDGLKNRIK